MRYKEVNEQKQAIESRIEHKDRPERKSDKEGERMLPTF